MENDHELQATVGEGNKESLSCVWGQEKVTRQSLYLIALKMVRALKMSPDANKDS